MLASVERGEFVFCTRAGTGKDISHLGNIHRG
jgi:hypothetical protein